MTARGPVVVRDARPEDAAAIASVHVASWQAAYRGVVADAHLDALDADARTSTWAERLAAPGPGMRTLVATVDGTVVGFVAAGPSRDADARPGVGEIQAIYVDPPAWAAGAGRALMASALVALGAGDPPVVLATLWVLRDNPRARRFYEAAGFRTDGTTATVTIGGADLVEVRYARTVGESLDRAAGLR